MHYWGFNAISAILRTNTHVVGDLYIPQRNTLSKKLLELVSTNSVSIVHDKCPYLNGQMNARDRYPLLITDSIVNPCNTFRTVEECISSVETKYQVVLILDGITDIGNIAAIMRSACGFSVTCVVTSHHTSRNIPILIRKSSGYCLNINIVEQVNIAYTIRTLQKHNFWIYGADSKGKSLFTVDFTAPKIALIIGDEHNGLRHRTRELCDFHVSIPHNAQVESFNVGVAAGIMLYEIARQNSIQEK